MKKHNFVSDELTEVRTAFEAWREERRGRQPIPARLWRAAVGLLDSYPISVVARELRLNPTGLRQRSRSSEPGAATTQFVEFPSLAGTSVPVGVTTPPKTTDSEIRLSLERRDGHRLSLVLPTAHGDQVERLWTAFLKG